jgi:hypothetical protein
LMVGVEVLRGVRTMRCHRTSTGHTRPSLCNEEQRPLCAHSVSDQCTNT